MEQQKEINLSAMVLTVFVISWNGVLPSLLIAYGVEIPGALQSLSVLMVLGPLVGAMIFIYRAQGVSGWKAFFKRRWCWARQGSSLEASPQGPGLAFWA